MDTTRARAIIARGLLNWRYVRLAFIASVVLLAFVGDAAAAATAMGWPTADTWIIEQACEYGTVPSGMSEMCGGDDPQRI